MWDFLRKLFDTSDFPSRWHCGNWSTGHGWLHIVSDLLIFGAYLAIPCALITFALRKRQEIAFNRLYLLFGAFILACGTTHLIEAIIFWNPVYRFSGVMKLTTALVSWGTVVALIHLAPQAMKLPGLHSLNQKLETALKKEHATATQLRRRNQELDEFAYMASHDLKAPLRAINHLSNWIEEDADGALPEESQQHLKQLKQRVSRMETLLDDLLEYSRVGREDYSTETVDLGSLGREVVELVKPPEGFTVSVHEPMPTVETWRVPLEQCLRNLISNAIKHHDREEGHVEMRCAQDGNFVVFRVEDDGPGIAPEFHEKIFGMFQTLKTRDQVEASGVGLAMIRKLVERNGGDIQIESDGSRGSTFVLTWPIHQPGNP